MPENGIEEKNKSFTQEHRYENGAKQSPSRLTNKGPLSWYKACAVSTSFWYSLASQELFYTGIEIHKEAITWDEMWKMNSKSIQSNKMLNIKY